MKGRALAYRALDGSEARVLCTAMSADAVRVVRVAACQTCMIDSFAQRSLADGAHVVVRHRRSFSDGPMSERSTTKGGDRSRELGANNHKCKTIAAVQTNTLTCMKRYLPL